MSTPIRIAILGASGYTGAELIRLLHHHPFARIVALSGDSQAGKPIGEVYSHLAHLPLTLCKHDAIDFGEVDVVFCCLPHGTTQPIIAALPESVKIIDLSADFRLHDLGAYAQWYGHPHQAPALQATAIYGLTERKRDPITHARLIANPGCYPTSILLPLLPLLEAGIIEATGLIADSMSGVSGAGRKAVQASLYSEVNESVRAYGVGGHRHVAEMEQELSLAAGQPVTLSFTPHLVPMNRGISSTIHARLTASHTLDDAYDCLKRAYESEPFVQLLPQGQTPATADVRGTNQCRIGLVADRAAGHLILVSVIDNLVKGASGQAIQNMNRLCGLPETTGLDLLAVFP